MEGGARKLTVPGFGTFMRRESGGVPSAGERAGGEIIFVDLLRGDDHVLSEMVEDSGRYTEVEAMARIDRFIFETKNSIERTGSAEIEGFGTMTLDHKGSYQFSHTPPAPPVRHAVQEDLFEAKNQPKSPAMTARTPVGSREGTSGGMVHRSSVPGFRPSQGDLRERQGAGDPRRRPGMPLRPGQKPPQRGPQQQGRRRKMKLSKIDIILIVAIAATVIALIAMVFGLSASSQMPFLN